MHGPRNLSGTFAINSIERSDRYLPRRISRHIAINKFDSRRIARPATRQHASSGADVADPVCRTRTQRKCLVVVWRSIDVFLDCRCGSINGCGRTSPHGFARRRPCRADALTELFPGCPFVLKWPNDVLIGDRKICRSGGTAFHRSAAGRDHWNRR